VDIADLGFGKLEKQFPGIKILVLTQWLITTYLLSRLSCIKIILLLLWEVLFVLDKINRCPLSYPQKGIWYIEKLYPDTSIGNIAATLKISGNIQFDVLDKAINKFIKMNDSMRIRVLEHNGEPEQYISEYRYCKLDYLDFSSGDMEELYTWDTKITRTPFFKLDSPLFYFAMIKINDNSGGFYVKLHHLIGDAWTLVNLGNEIVENYKTISNGNEIIIENKPSYLEFLLSEQQYLQSERFYKDEEYWVDKFDTLPELTILKDRKSYNKSIKASRKTFVLPGKLSAKIRKHCSEYKTSIFALFLGAMAIYINRTRGKDEVIFGTPVLNRSNKREKETMGMFISTVPIRIKIDDNLDYTSFAEGISKEWMSILRHQRYSYTLLLKKLRQKHKDIDKLYDIVISYQNAKVSKKENVNEREGRWHFNGYQTESLCLHINDREDDGNIVLDYDYLSDLFYAKEIEYIHDHMTRLLWHALDNPARKLPYIEMISEKEKQKILYDFNNTNAEYPRDKTIHQLFEEQVEKTPDAVAVVFDDREMTYRELNENANKLAGVLRAKGVKPNEIVGLMVNRSLEMIVGIFAILKAGGAYLPIDPEYPEERIRYMLGDSNARILLTQKSFNADLYYRGQLIELDNLMDNTGFLMDNFGLIKDDASSELSNLENVNKPCDLIYIIYTSGSTGKPKGAMIEHRNVVRLLFNDKFQFDFNSKDVWTMFHSFCFDFSVWEMYGALLYGGKLIIISKGATQDTKEFVNILKKEKVTVLNQTPAAFYNLINEEIQCSENSLALRYVVFGGEALKPVMLKPFKEKYPDTRLINMYGITETTVHVTFKELGEEDISKNISNVGKPIPTLKTYIVDKYLNLLPIGIPGELCVSGDGVGRGYLNKESLTKEKFVPNPFCANEVMYRSGDLARLFAQGDIEYLGRIDNQVKIRGHRIELGEIESQMLKYGEIKEAVVIARNNKLGNKQLCAYYVSESSFKTSELREFLLKYLPDYMIPTYFIRVNKMPLTSNGKIDKKNLPQPEEKFHSEDEYAAPQNKIQESLVQIWSQVLGVGEIGINDNFFHMGGDSLSAISVVSKIGGDITFSDLYNNPTIKMLSEALTNKDKESLTNKILIKMAASNLETSNNIICFPYGGGNAAIYKDLADSVLKISEDYSLYAVNLPGHDIGCNEGLLPNHETALRLLKEIKETITGDIILYGHCVGSALTIETAKLLQDQNIRVKAILIGGILPPGKTNIPGENYDPWRLVSDKNIIRFLNRIGLPKFDLENEYTSILIKSFRHDVRNYYKFFYEFGTKYREKLDNPIYFIAGEKDLITKGYKSRYKNWGKYSKHVELITIEGANHYFIKTHSSRLAEIIIQISREAVLMEVL